MAGLRDGGGKARACVAECRGKVGGENSPDPPPFSVTWELTAEVSSQKPEKGWGSGGGSPPPAFLSQHPQHRLRRGIGGQPLRRPQPRQRLRRTPRAAPPPPPGRASAAAAPRRAVRAVQVCWICSGTTSRSASRFTSEACGTCTSMRTIAAVIGFTPIRHHMRNARHRHLQRGCAGLDQPRAARLRHGREGIVLGLVAFHQDGRDRPIRRRRAHRLRHDGRHGHDRAQPRHALRRRCAARRRKSAAAASLPSAGCPGITITGRSSSRSPCAARNRAASPASAPLSSTGWPDEGHGDVGLLEEHRLEGQQAQDAVHLLPQLHHAPRPPGPDLRRHVMHHRNAQRLHPFRHAQREAGAVDRHQHCRASRHDIGHRIARCSRFRRKILGSTSSSPISANSR